MTDDLIISVTQNVFLLTFVMLTAYPVIYIIRSMVDFVSRAFSSININKIFKVGQVDIGRHTKIKTDKEL